MGSKRTIITLSEDDKKWLESYSRALNISAAEAIRFVMELEPKEAAISVLTRAEILVGVDSSEESLGREFLAQYCLFSIEKPITDLSAALRKQYGWRLPDAFQAALARYHRMKLTTRNTKDFDPEKHDFVEVPYGT